MKLAIAIATLIGMIALGLSTLTLRAQGATRSVENGVYSKAQADAGRTHYAQLCSPCHGEALTGGEMAPPLAGGAFLSNWKGLTVFDFFDRIRKTMPVGKEGSLSRETCAQITAFVLSSNGYPAGSLALDTHDDPLRNITIDVKK